MTGWNIPPGVNERDIPGSDPDQYEGPWTVAIFMMDRQYGGPEEGGWYYDVGEPELEYAHLVKGFEFEEDANAYCSELQRLTEELNKGRPSIGSVLSRGRYAARICEGYPKSFPAERPHYE